MNTLDELTDQLTHKEVSLEHYRTLNNLSVNHEADFVSARWIVKILAEISIIKANINQIQNG